MFFVSQNISKTGYPENSFVSCQSAIFQHFSYQWCKHRKQGKKCFIFYVHSKRYVLTNIIFVIIALQNYNYFMPLDQLRSSDV